MMIKQYGNFITCLGISTLLFAGPVEAAQVESGILRNLQEAGSGVTGDYSACSESPQKAYQRAQDILRLHCGDQKFRSNNSAASIADCLNLPIALRVCIGFVDKPGIEDFVSTSKSISDFIDSGNLPAQNAEAAATTVYYQILGRGGNDVNRMIDKEFSDFKEQLKKKAQPFLNGAQLNLANIRGAQRQMTDLKAAYEAKLAAYIAEYQAAAAKAKAYSALRAQIIADLTSIARQASLADLEAAPYLSVKLTLIAAQNDQLTIFPLLELSSLQRAIILMKDDYDSRFAALITSMGKYKVPTVDGIKPLLDGIGTMTENYTSSRSVISNATTELQKQLSLRQDGLIKQRADDLTKTAQRDSAQLSSSGRFLEENADLMRAAWKNVPKVAGYPLLGSQFQAMNDLVSRESMCSFVAYPGKEWMATGCKFLVPEIKKVKNFQASTLPIILQSYIDVLEANSSGRIHDLLDQAASRLRADDISAAVKLYDSAVGMLEVVK